MVATRRGGRACSPTKSNSDESADVSATPSSRSGRRRTTNKEQSATVLPKTPGGDDEEDEDLPTPLQNSTVKRRIRSSKLQSHQLDSTHEADISDSESCCSASSKTDHPILSRGRRKTPGRSSNQSGDVSDVDSCSLVTSASRVRSRARCETKRAAGQSDTILMESEESCGSVMSDTQRATRSMRRRAVAPPLANRGAEDTGDASEVDSCASSVSATPSTRRRPARSRADCAAQPIPMHLDEASDLPQSPTPSQRTRATVDRGAWDSEGFESGPSMTPRRSTRKRTAPRYLCSGTTDSDDSLNVSSPASAGRGRGVPCGSWTGTNSRGISVSRLSVVVERAVVSVLEEGADMVQMPTEKPCHLGKVSVSQGEQEESVLEDSKLDATIGPEDMTLTLEEEKDVIDLTDQDDPAQGLCLVEESQKGSVIVSGEPLVEVLETASDVACGPAVSAADQQRGQAHSAASTEEDVGAMMPEPEAGSELELHTGDRGGVTVCYGPGTEEKEEDMDVASSRAHSSEIHGDDACHLVLSEEEREQENVGVEDEELQQEVVEAQRGEMGVVEGEEEVLMLEEEGMEEEGKKDEEVMLEEVGEEEKEEVVVIDEEEDQQQEDLVVERKEAQVAVLKEQEEVATEENQEEVNVMIKKKVDSVSVVMEEELEKEVEEEMELSVSAPQVLHAACEAAPQPLLPDSIQVTSSQQLKVIVSEEQHPNELLHSSIIVQKAKVISLLDSSEDEEDEEEGEESSGHEDEEEDSKDLAGPSQSKPVSDGLFVIDTRPGQQDRLLYKETQEEAGTDAEDEEEFVDEEGDDDEDDDDKALFTIKSQTSMELSSRIDAGLRARELGGLYVCFDGGRAKSVPSNHPQKTQRKSEDQVMKRSVIGPEFEKQDAVPPYSESKQALKQKRKEEREKTTGDGWFNMRAPEMTTELKGDLKALKMRAAMDPKRFYKKNDRDGFPKYFQVGTVVDSPVDFYHSRIPKKDRKRTMVEELLADAEFRHANKKKYQQIMTEKAALGAGRRRNRNLKKRKK